MEVHLRHLIFNKKVFWYDYILQVILDNLQVMKRTIAEIERCRAGLGLPVGAEHTLSAFHRAQQLQQPLHGLQQLTEEQSAAIRVCTIL